MQPNGTTAKMHDGQLHSVVRGRYSVSDILAPQAKTSPNEPPTKAIVHFHIPTFPRGLVGLWLCKFQQRSFIHCCCGQWSVFVVHCGGWQCLELVLCRLAPTSLFRISLRPAPSLARPSQSGRRGASTPNLFLSSSTHS